MTSIYDVAGHSDSTALFSDHTVIICPGPYLQVAEI